MTTARGDSGSRRAPRQRRSRERVERILDAASAEIVDHGVDALSTRGIAARSGMPVASLYQYFADKEEILLALVARDTEEMDRRVDEAVAALTQPTMHTLVEATMRAFVAVYHHRPAFVVIWWRGRTNTAVQAYCREHNRLIARRLYDFAVATGLVAADTDPRVAELAVEVGDRAFQVAFERDLRGERWVIDEAITLVSGYLERYAAS